MYSRLWFGSTAIVVSVGLTTQSIATAGADAGHFTTAPSRIVNLLFYFTIESNILVGVTSLLLALQPQRGHVFAGFRLAGVMGIALTGVVYHSVLRDLYELTGLAKFSDVVLHTAVPILAVLGWLLYGPRRAIDRIAVGIAIAYPLGYFAITLIRGPIVDFYPYPFVDVRDHGYPRVLLNALLVAAIYVALATGMRWLDRRLTRLQPRGRADSPGYGSSS